MKSETRKIKLFSSSPPNSTIFVLGATGCGKSTLIANLLLERDRFLIVDVKDEWPAGFFPESLVVNDLTALGNALNQGKSRLILKIPQDVLLDQGQSSEFISVVCFHLIKFCQANKGLKITLCMDEFNRFVTPNSCPRGLFAIITGGRSLGIQKIFGAQWFNNVPTWARDSFSEIYVYSHSEPRGLAMLGNYGFDADCIRNLPPNTVLHKAKGEIMQIKLQAYGKSNS